MADPGNRYYLTKQIQFLNRSVSILLQNTNGPCPLLAICNCLLLNGSIHIHEDQAAVDEEQIVNLIANRLIETNLAVEGETLEMSENRQTQLNDAISILPILQRGLDVNIKFGGSVKGFEYTKEFTPFDMLGLDLVHGWLADPQDEKSYEVISKLTYNHAVEKLIQFRNSTSQNQPSSSSTSPLSPPPPEEATRSISPTPSSEVTLLPCVISPTSTSSSPPSTSSSSSVEISNAEIIPCIVPLKGQSPNEITTPNPNETPLVEVVATIVNTTSQADSITSQAETIPTLEIQIPNSAVGVVIGRGGETIRTLQSETNVSIQIAPQNPTSGNTNRSVTLRGTQCHEAASKIMALINTKFQPLPFPDVGIKTVRAEERENEGPVDQQKKGQEEEEEVHGGAPGGLVLDADLDSEICDDEQDKNDEINKDEINENEEDEKQKQLKLDQVYEEGLIIDAFMQSSSHQLTYHGLLQLYEHLKERQVAIFFRNNHFCTIFKLNSMLYLLVTDEGYQNEQQVIWEKLDEIDGDTEYYNANFQPSQFTLPPSPPSTTSSSSSSSTTTSTALVSGDLIDPDYLLAMQLSNEASVPPPTQSSSGVNNEAGIPVLEGRLVSHHDSISTNAPSTNTPPILPATSEPILASSSTSLPTSTASHNISSATPAMTQIAQVGVEVNDDDDASYALRLQQQLNQEVIQEENQLSSPPLYQDVVSSQSPSMAQFSSMTSQDEEYAFVLQQQMNEEEAASNRHQQNRGTQRRESRPTRAAPQQQDKKEGGCNVQ
mmetsp:Transcript_37345/g.48316  ORF Transcript_37345/g.48316 Transcript_37345/m.48316 type:complete len:774 (-) Transcript_37345:242-2563(-)